MAPGTRQPARRSGILPLSERGQRPRLREGRSARSVAVAAGVIFAALAAGLLILGGGWAGTAAGGVGLWASLHSPLFLLCAAVTTVCVLGLAVLCGALWAAGRSAGVPPARVGEGRGQDARDTEDGSATLEFALILPIAMMFVLVMTQSSLLMGGNLCVNYAAFCAARSAIVNVPRDFSPEEWANYVGDPVGSSKLRRIKLAAVWAVLPISCAHPDGPSVGAGTLQSGLEAAFTASGVPTPPWVGPDLGRRLAYAEDHTAVELGHDGNYGPSEDILVRVRHDFYLSVPYAARVFSKIAGDGMTLDFGRGQYALIMRSSCRLTNEGEQDFVDVERFPRDRVRN